MTERLPVPTDWTPGPNLDDNLFICRGMIAYWQGLAKECQAYPPDGRRENSE